MSFRGNGVLWTLLAGTLLLNVGCVGLNNGVSSNGTLKQQQSDLIGNNSAALIGNNSAALANKSLASLDSAVVDVEGARMSKLIGNNAASLIGNNSAALIGNNSAALIGNNAASYRIATFLSAPALTWVDSGNWPTTLASGLSVSGTRTGSIADKGAVEVYGYTHDLQEYVGSTMERYHRVETVTKSLGRRLGEYVFDGFLNKSGADQGFYVYKQKFTPAGGVPLEVVLKRMYNVSGGSDTAVVHQFMSGYTSTGASVSLTTTSYTNANAAQKTASIPGSEATVTLKANTLSYVQSGTIEGVDGASFALDTTIEGPFPGSTTTGTVDIRTLGRSATDSVKIHFALSQPASGPVTYTGELRDGADKPLATLEHLASRGVFRATFTDGATQDIPIATIDKVLDIANEGPKDW